MVKGAEAMRMRLEAAGIKPNPFGCSDPHAGAHHDDAVDSMDDAVWSAQNAEGLARYRRAAEAKSYARRSARAAGASKAAASRAAERAAHLERQAMAGLGGGMGLDEVDDVAGAAIYAADIADDAADVAAEAEYAARHAAYVAKL